MKEIVIFKVKNVKWTKNLTQTMYKLYTQLLQNYTVTFCVFPSVSALNRFAESLISLYPI
jgi:hypothetical protein